MKKSDVDEFVRSTLADEFEVDAESIRPESKLFEELDLDSIDAVDLVVRLQKKYSVSIQPGDFKEIRTYADLLEVICRVVGAEG